MKSGTFEDDSGRKQHSRHLALALRAFIYRLIGHLLKLLELVLAYLALIDIRRHYITS